MAQIFTRFTWRKTIMTYCTPFRREDTQSFPSCDYVSAFACVIQHLAAQRLSAFNVQRLTPRTRRLEKLVERVLRDRHSCKHLRLQAWQDKWQEAGTPYFYSRPAITNKAPQMKRVYTPSTEGMTWEVTQVTYRNSSFPQDPCHVQMGIHDD
ncbi:hypothetical protein BJV77DRAFT_807486 [Russula vinacea]|nr:hypothetical protein BJV77DRAFT_807486 [Russula vinacea]